jgi:predicted ATP-grasp superfamily ATP-dependent carboligase
MTRVFVYEYISASAPEATPDLLAQGRAMRDAMLADLGAMADVHVTCAAPTREVPTLAARNVSLCAAAAGESPRAFVERESLRHEVVWVVAPEFDGILQGLCDSVAPHRWLGCSGAAIALAGSKHATADHLSACGIASTQPWREGASSGSPGQRWVVKPEYGAGTEATFRYDSLAAAQAAAQARAAAGEAVTLERWVEGDALSVSLLCQPGNHQILSINRQHIRVDHHGQLHYEGVTLDAIGLLSMPGEWIIKVALQVLESMPGLAGFVGVDMVWHAQRGPVVIEVNPRLTCAYVGLSAYLQRNLAREMLATHQVNTEMMLLDGAAP